MGENHVKGCCWAPEPSADLALQGFILTLRVASEKVGKAQAACGCNRNLAFGGSGGCRVRSQLGHHSETAAELRAKPQLQVSGT